MDSARLGGAYWPLPALSRLPEVHLQGLWRSGSRAPLAATVASAAALAAAAALTAFGRDETAGRTALDALLIGTPLAVGLYALRTPRTARFGRLLIAAGLLWALAALGDAQRSLPYSTGRIAAWCVFPIIVYLLLSFPEGRLTATRDVRLFRGVFAVVAILFVGSAPFIETYPGHSPWVSCAADCPANAFFILSSEPGFIGSVLEPLREALGAALLAGVSISLATRMRASSRARRATIAPVLAVGAAATIVLVGFLVARNAAPDARVADAMGVVWSLSLVAVAAAFSFGVLRRRLVAGNVLCGLGLALHASPGPRQLSAMLRSSIGDPTAEVLVLDPQTSGWRHDDGRPVEEELPARGAGRAGDPRRQGTGGRDRARLRARRGRRTDRGHGRPHGGGAARVAAPGGAGCLAQRPRRLAQADRDGRGRRAPPHRARPARRRAAAAHRAAHAPLADRGPRPPGRRRDRGDPQPRARRGPRPRGDPVAGPRDLPGAPGRPRAQGRAAERRAAIAGAASRCRRTTSRVIRPRSRPPCTSPASRRSRTRSSTGTASTRVQIRCARTTCSRSRSSTTAPGSTPRSRRPAPGSASMHDRVESLGGTLTVESAPGRGTVVRGTVPLATRVAAQPSYRG